jgi:hypothetical protein
MGGSNERQRKRRIVSADRTEFDTYRWGYAWTGVHPDLPYACYQIEIRRDEFRRIYSDATHEITISVRLTGNSLFRVSTDRAQWLYWQQAAYANLRGLTADQYVLGAGRHLVRFLLEMHEPQRVPGMYSLLKKNEYFRCPWDIALDDYRIKVLEDLDNGGTGEFTQGG